MRLENYTGLRPGAVEMLSLSWGNVSWDQHAIQILSAHKGGPIRRVVDIHPEFIPVLDSTFGEANSDLSFR